MHLVEETAINHLLDGRQVLSQMEHIARMLPGDFGGSGDGEGDEVLQHRLYLAIQGD